MRRTHPIVAAASVAALVLAGCGSTTAPPVERPTAVAFVEVMTLPSSQPDPSYDATCQLGADLRFSAEGSHDPAGQTLAYEWTDTANGEPSTDFGPAGAIRTTDPVMHARLSTPAEHVVTLTVTARDGRKSRAQLRILVTGCECGLVAHHDPS